MFFINVFFTPFSLVLLIFPLMLKNLVLGLVAGFLLIAMSLILHLYVVIKSEKMLNQVYLKNKNYAEQYTFNELRIMKKALINKLKAETVLKNDKFINISISDFFNDELKKDEINLELITENFIKMIKDYAQMNILSLRGKFFK